MLIQILAFAAGLLLLYLGAEGLVRGASRLARSLGVSALVVGLTVVAFGTSMPEMVVSTLAAARGQSDVSLGNVVGSNIVNIALILGLAAVVFPLRVELRLLAREIPLMIGVSLGLLLLMLDGDLGRVDAAVLLVAFAGYLVFVSRAARTSPPTIEEEFSAFEETSLPLVVAPRRAPDVLLILLGLGALVGGAHLLVESSVFFARRMGVPELVIALTLVAAGTSLPELATSVVAAFRKSPDIAIGNIVGSNIFNILAILGVSAALWPLQAAPSLLRFDTPVMIGVAVLLLPLAWTRFELTRWEGAFLLAGYGAYLAFLLL